MHIWAERAGGPWADADCVVSKQFMSLSCSELKGSHGLWAITVNSWKQHSVTVNMPLSQQQSLLISLFEFVILCWACTVYVCEWACWAHITSCIVMCEICHLLMWLVTSIPVLLTFMLLSLFICHPCLLVLPLSSLVTICCVLSLSFSLPPLHRSLISASLLLCSMKRQ